MEKHIESLEVRIIELTDENRAKDARIAELESTVESQGEYIDELEKDVVMLTRRRRGLGDPSLAQQ